MQSTTTTVVLFDLGNTLLVKRPDKDERRLWTPGAKEALASLCKTPLRLGLLSNTGDLNREQLQERFLPRDFAFGIFEEELVILSGEVDLKKPDPRIYALAIKRAGVSADQILYVGEDPKETEGAEAAGMRSHLINALPDDLNKLTDKLGASRSTY